jgi:hypothetical protein
MIDEAEKEEEDRSNYYECFLFLSVFYFYFNLFICLVWIGLDQKEVS